MEQQLQLVSDLDIEIKRLQVCNINPVSAGQRLRYPPHINVAYNSLNNSVVDPEGVHLNSLLAPVFKYPMKMK